MSNRAIKAVLLRMQSCLCLSLLTASVFGLSSCASPATPGRSVAQNAARAPILPSADAAGVDQEVAAILAGQHGTLPPAEQVRSDPTAQAVEVVVTNDTDYPLTLLYSGPTSRRLSIAPHETERTILGVGRYEEAAKVEKASVTPYAGEEFLEGGLYESSFFIRTRSQ